MDYAHRQEAKKFDDFFTARRYAGATYAVVVCLSVCLSVTNWHCTKTAKHRITQTTPYDGAGKGADTHVRLILAPRPLPYPISIFTTVLHASHDFMFRFCNAILIFNFSV